MSPRPTHSASLNLERIEDRINMSGADPVADAVGGSSALSSLISLDSNFLQGYTSTQALLNAVGGPTDIGHVLLDTQAVFGTIYGASYLQNPRTALLVAIEGLEMSPGDPGLIANFGSSAKALASAAGAAYAVEQDLVAHGIPAIPTIQSFGASALQTVQNAAIATLNSVVSIVNSLNSLANETIDQAIQDLSQPLVPPDDPTLTMPTVPPPAPPPPPMDDDDNVLGDDAMY